MFRWSHSSRVRSRPQALTGRTRGPASGPCVIIYHLIWNARRTVRAGRNVVTLFRFELTAPVLVRVTAVVFPVTELLLVTLNMSTCPENSLLLQRMFFLTLTSNWKNLGYVAVPG